jgi:trans-aconitate 2-methyltransferase
MSDAWNPAQYSRFAAERAQPFHDLAGLLHPPFRSAAAGLPVRAIDLGCGDGRLTRELQGLLAAAAGQPVDLLGIDNSLKMVQACREHTPALAVSVAGSPDYRQAAGLPSPRFALGDVVRFGEKALLGELAPYAVVFSNAALQWVPDHPRLLIGLAEAVAPGGQLALQMPANQGHPSQRIARELAAEAPFAAELEGYGGESPTTVLAPEQYATLLHRYGFAEQHVRLQVYGHLLADSSEVVEWVRGTLLTAYQQRLSAPRWEEFLAEYRRRIAAELGSGREYLLTYNRLLLWGRKA